MYTAGETAIGVWTDGRTIYRNIITGIRTPSQNTTYEDITKAPCCTDPDFVLRCDLIFNKTNGAPRVINGSTNRSIQDVEGTVSNNIIVPDTWIQSTNYHYLARFTSPSLVDCIDCPAILVVEYVKLATP